MDLEKTFEKDLEKETANNFLKENVQSEDDLTEDDLMKILDSDPTLRELAQAVSEEFDENGHYIGK